MISDHTTQAPTTSWSAGAWFGSQLGGTLWLAISAGVLMARSPTLAALLLALFFAVNGVGLLLWRRRSRLSMFRALQTLLAALWGVGMAAIFAIDRAGLWESLAIGGTNNTSVSSAYVMLTGLAVALIGMFQFQHRRSWGPHMLSTAASSSGERANKICSRRRVRSMGPGG